MTEFMINFRFKNKSCRAAVLREKRGVKLEYDVRPVNPSIVKAFGHQIRVFKEGEDYRISSQITPIHQELIDTLVEAIHAYERDKSSEGT